MGLRESPDRETTGTLIRDLEALIAEAACASRVTITMLEKLSGGAVQENWFLRADITGGPEAGTCELVLRRDAPSRVPVSRSRGEEFALLRAARDAGVTVPEPLWLADDPARLGAPAYIMRHIAGTAAGHRIVRDAFLGGDRDALAGRLGEELARIHKIRPPRNDLSFLSVPAGSPALAAVAEYRGYLDALKRPFPALEWGLRQLELEAPDTEEITLIHRDFRTGNYMVDECGLTGILDWEFAAFGDPMEDVGWFCARCWRFGAVDREAGGIADREPFYRGYERMSGRAVDPAAVRYWEIMAHIRWAIIALLQGERHLSGQEPSLELALTGRIAAECALEVLQLLARANEAA